MYIADNRCQYDDMSKSGNNLHTRYNTLQQSTTNLSVPDTVRRAQMANQMVAQAVEEVVEVLEEVLEGVAEVVVVILSQRDKQRQRPYSISRSSSDKFTLRSQPKPSCPSSGNG